MTKEILMKNMKRFLRLLPDSQYIKFYFRLRVKRKLDIKTPIYFNDKLQWLKFNYRSPLQSIVSDKYLVRDYVCEKAGAQYLIPLHGIWENFDDIDFDKLPNRFVLKCNHDSGGLAICTDRKNFDIKKAKRKIQKSLNQNFFYIGREFQYKNIKPRIICEDFISKNKSIPMDYKIYCFNGIPDAIMVCKGRFERNSNKAQYFFFDYDWNFLRYNKCDEFLDVPDIEKPKNLDEMLEVAKKLSKDFVFARIDLYNIDGKIYFGEITLTPNSGFSSDISTETDYYFGNKLQIPYWEVINK